MQKIFVITAPSGSGKSTIAASIMARCPELSFSISATTRLPRGNEIDGKEYHFMNVPQFQSLIEEGAFLEWEMVYEGKYYGTLNSEISRIFNEGKVPLLDIDVVGASELKEQYGEKVFVFFIKPPSIQELESRLRKRSTDSETMIQERLAKAAFELTFESKFDKVIINNNLEEAIEEFYATYCSELK